MKKYYAIILFVFVFQLATTAINAGDVFITDMNEIGGATIEQINSSAYNQLEVDQDAGDQGVISSLFEGAGLMLMALKMMVIVFAKSVVILPTLTSYGLPVIWAGVFQGAYTLIMALAIIEFKTGRRTS